jgi:hypothetical protein
MVERRGRREGEEDPLSEALAALAPLDGRKKRVRHRDREGGDTWHPEASGASAASVELLEREAEHSIALIGTSVRVRALGKGVSF